MKRPFCIPAILLCLFFTACNAVKLGQNALAPRDFSISPGQSITVAIDSGTVNISQAKNSQLQLSGVLPDSKSIYYKTSLETDGVHIVESEAGNPIFQSQAAPIELNLAAPAGVLIKITDYDANINVQGYRGQVNITTVAGDILADHVSGSLSLISNRGNVTVENSNGEIHLDGNYGQLSLLNSAGVIHATTIVGSINFRGKIEDEDNVSLETDHGPIGIQIDSGSNASVQINTTSGVVVCSMTGIHYEGQKCGGTLGRGQGKLLVRTVSGTVTLGPIL